jgi:hypothetical protein
MKCDTFYYKLDSCVLLRRYLIRAVALFKIKQRQSVDNCIEATIEDFERAKSIYMRTAKVDSERLDMNERKIIEHLMSRMSEWVSRSELNEGSGVVYTTMVDILHGKNRESGLVNRIMGLEHEKRKGEDGRNRDYYMFRGSLTPEGIDTIGYDNVHA